MIQLSPHCIVTADEQPGGGSAGGSTHGSTSKWLRPHAASAAAAITPLTAPRYHARADIDAWLETRLAGARVVLRAELAFSARERRDRQPFDALGSTFE